MLYCAEGLCWKQNRAIPVLGSPNEGCFVHSGSWHFLLRELEISDAFVCMRTHIKVYADTYIKVYAETYGPHTPLYMRVLILLLS